MQNHNPIITTREEPFIVGESDFRFFEEHPHRCESGAIIFCQGGTAEVSVNLHRGEMQSHVMVFVMPGMVLMFNNISTDFNASFCAFSEELFAEAGFRLEPSFFRFLSETPISQRRGETIRGVEAWLQVAAYTYADRENVFRSTIIKNRLQNIFLEIYDKLLRKTDQIAEAEVGRRIELFQKFIQLVRDQCTEQREVGYYADKLCISTRYLSSIVRSMAHKTAKGTIDQFVVLEIKMLLQSTDLSVQEIADRLHFSDQSYMGHYFRRHTGHSPSEYRSRR